MTLKELRKTCKLTQKEAADVVGMPLRTFVSYESDEKNRHRTGSGMDGTDKLQ